MLRTALGPASVFGLLDPFPNARKIRAVACPLWFVHGTRDPICPAANALRLHAAAPREATRHEPIFWVPRGSHGDVLHVAPGEFAKHQRATLHEALLDLWIKRGEKLRSRHWVLDPVSRPRVAWRWAGVWLLLGAGVLAYLIATRNGPWLISAASLVVHLLLLPMGVIAGLAARRGVAGRVVRRPRRRREAAPVALHGARVGGRRRGAQGRRRPAARRRARPVGLSPRDTGGRARVTGRALPAPPCGARGMSVAERRVPGGAAPEADPRRGPRSLTAGRDGPGAHRAPARGRRGRAPRRRQLQDVRRLPRLLQGGVGGRRPADPRQRGRPPGPHVPARPMLLRRRVLARCVEIKIIRSGYDRLVDFHTGGAGRSGCGATASPRRRRSPGATARSRTPRGPWPRPGRRASAGTRRPSSGRRRPRSLGAPRPFRTPSSRWPYQCRTTATAPPRVPPRGPPPCPRGGGKIGSNQKEI